MHAALQDYQRGGLLPDALLDTLTHDLQGGGSLINHLQRHLGPDLEALWERIALKAGREFIATPSEAGPLDVGLLTVQDAHDYLVVPRVRKFLTIHLITPDPFARLSDYQPLRAQYNNAEQSGGLMQIRLDIAPPETFRELFALAYPGARAHYRDAADAGVLASLLPRRTQQEQHVKPTPEEAARAAALFTGLPYLDPVLDPPHEAVVEAFPLEAFTTRRLYPHHHDERGRLVVLGSVQRLDDLDAELQRLHTHLALLQDAFRSDMTLALTSSRRLVQLFKFHSGGSHVHLDS
ncbi:hypothetical protein [Deinococcus ruber]|uniref:Uncharacterized protein n=1 Tax=Deinococcus ruber TaxID=1848197 RepID=A0A918CC82_9DEIO|nr:hypothetical protein [Deinococcus ruber]GGR15356.1 hypothetical protein GCM10008957_30120 [Deinococcus ruber]